MATCERRRRNRDRWTWIFLAAVVAASVTMPSRLTGALMMNTGLQEGIWKLESAKGEVSTHYLEIVETGDLERADVQRLVLIRDTADRKSRIVRIGYVVPGTDLLILSSRTGHGRATVGICRLEGAGKFVRAIYSIDRRRSSRGFEVELQTWTHLGR